MRVAGGSDMKQKMMKSAKAKLISVLTIFMVLFCAVSITVLRFMNEAHQEALRNQLLYYVYVDGFADASTYLTTEVRAYAATGDRTHYDNYWYEVNTAKNRETNTALLNELGLTSEEQNMVSSIANISNNLIPLEEKAMEYTQKNNLASAMAILYGAEYQSGVNEIHDTISEFNISIQTRVEETVQSTQLWVNILTILSYICVVLTLLVQARMIIFVLKELLVPVSDIQGKMLKMSKGQLHEDFSDLEVDNTEIGQIAQAILDVQKALRGVIEDASYCLKEMASGNFGVESKAPETYVGDLKQMHDCIHDINIHISDALQTITVGAEQVASGAEQVSTGAQALAQGATEQASAVEELSATVTEISDSARNNALNSEQALDLVLGAGNQIQESEQYMLEMVNAMEEINGTSHEIGKIIATIENIAFQTNILALNAAVEAARAGAAGKGFAVVADEVRNLATKSDQAAKATKELIDNSVTAVDKGNDIVKKVSDSLNKTIVQTSQAMEAMKKVNKAVEDESEALEQVSDGIDQISSVVQTNSATSEQSAAASEELTGQTVMIKGQLNKFRLRRGSGSANVNYDSYSYMPSNSADFNDDYKNSFGDSYASGSKY